MKHSFRRIGLAVATLVASIGVGLVGGTAPAGALQLEDTPTLAGHRCYVRSAYDVFLDRAATEEEKSVQADLLATGTTKATILNAVAATQEWRTHILTGITRAALDRDPTPTEITTLATAVKINKNTPINPVAGDVYGGTEFYANVGNDDEAYVDELYDRILHRPADAGGKTYWVGQIASKGRDWVAEKFYASPESRTDRIEALYQTILGRDPDPEGLTFWVEQLATKNDVAVSISIAGSSEFGTLAANACSPSVAPYFPLTLGTPLDPPAHPGYTIAQTTLDGAMPLSGTGCTTVNPSSAAETVLLVAQPGESAEQWRTALAGAGRLTDLFKVCRVELPASAADTWDATRSAQYIGRAIQRLSFFYSRPVDVVADGLGALGARWAVRWYPSVRGLVDDLVTIGVPNHGSIDAMYDDTATPTPVSQQSRADSGFIAALNSWDESPGTISYTTIASGTDHATVGRGPRDRRENAWHLSPATNVANIRVQNSCPALDLRRTGVRDHPWVWAAVRDALGSVGPASVADLASTPCGSNAGADSIPTLDTAVAANSEPPLPDYVPVLPEVVAPHPTAATAIAALPTTAPNPSTRILTAPGVESSLQCDDDGEQRWYTQPLLIVGGGPSSGSGDFPAVTAHAGFVDQPGPGLFPVCWVQMPAVIDPDGAGPRKLDPNAPASDAYLGSQYVVQAIRDLAQRPEVTAVPGTQVDVTAHSRGGFDTMWAMRWWPDLGDLVDDVVLLDSFTRGISSNIGVCGSGTAELLCTPLGQQIRKDSKEIAALKIDPPTGPDPKVSWTTIGMWSGPSIARDQWDVRMATFRLPGATNILVEQHCAGRVVGHDQVYTDAWVWRGIEDALLNPGTAVPTRFADDVPCGTPTWRSYPAPRVPPAQVPPSTDPCPVAAPPSPYVRVCAGPLPAYVWNDPTIPG